MAVEWKDRIVEHPRRYQLVPVAGQEGVFDLVAVTGEVTEVGTPVNAVNMETTSSGLSQRKIVDNEVINFSTDPEVSSFESDGIVPYDGSIKFPVKETIYSGVQRLKLKGTPVFGTGSMCFSDNGMFVFAGSASVITKYSVTSPFDISSASPVQTLSLLADLGSSMGFKYIDFFDGGRKILLTAAHLVALVSLSTAYDLNTKIAYSSFNTGDAVNLQGASITNNGTRMWFTNGTQLMRHTLTTAWNLGTATNSFTFAMTTWSNVNMLTGNLRFFKFNEDGTSIRVVHSNNPSGVRQCNISVPFEPLTANMSNATTLTNSTFPSNWLSQDFNYIVYRRNLPVDEIVLLDFEAKLSGSIVYKFSNPVTIKQWFTFLKQHSENAEVRLDVTNSLDNSILVNYFKDNDSLATIPTSTNIGCKVTITRSSIGDSVEVKYINRRYLR